MPGFFLTRKMPISSVYNIIWQIKQQNHLRSCNFIKKAFTYVPVDQLIDWSMNDVSSFVLWNIPLHQSAFSVSIFALVHRKLHKEVILAVVLRNNGAAKGCKASLPAYSAIWLISQHPRPLCKVNGALYSSSRWTASSEQASELRRRQVNI